MSTVAVDAPAAPIRFIAFLEVVRRIYAEAREKRRLHRGEQVVLDYDEWYEFRNAMVAHLGFTNDELDAPILAITDRPVRSLGGMYTAQWWAAIALETWRQVVAARDEGLPPAALAHRMNANVARAAAADRERTMTDRTEREESTRRSIAAERDRQRRVGGKPGRVEISEL